MIADDLTRRLDEGSVVVIDVRTREEYEGNAGYPCDPRQGHIPGAVSYTHLTLPTTPYV